MYKLSVTALCAGLAAAAIASPAAAHHPGGPGNTGGAGPINTISATTLRQGQSAVSVMFEGTWLGGLDDHELAEAAEADEHAHAIGSIASPSVSVVYGITNDITVGLRLPYVIRNDIREGEHGHHEEEEEEEEEEHGGEVVRRGDAEGIGDLALFGQWRVLDNRQSGTEAAILAGVKAPTGENGEIDSEGERFEAEFQPGSGSWDGSIGLALTQRWGVWSFDANVLYTLVGEGDQGTDLGDRVHYNFAVSYRALGGAGGAGGPMYAGAHGHGSDHQLHEGAPHDTRMALDLVLELNGEWHDKQEIAGLTDDNSGGNVIYLAPGARLSMNDWSGFVSVGLPVVNDLNGLQSEPDVRLVTGVSLGF